MPALTWRDVSAPNFAPATDALRTAAGLFDGAFSGLAEGFKNFEGKRDDRLNNAFQLEILKYQDPEAYKAALQSGEIYGDIDRRRLNADSIAAVGERTGTLLNEKHKGLQIDRDQFTFSEDKAKAERSAALAPILTKAATIGNEEEALAYVQQEAGKIGLRADEMSDTLDSIFSFADSRSGLANDRQDRRIAENEEGRTQTLFDRDTVSYKEGREAQTLLADITARSGGDSALAFQLLQESDATGNVYNLVREGLGGFTSGGGAGGGGVGLTGTPGGIVSGDFNEIVTRLWDTEGGYANDPDDPGGETMYGITARTARANGYTGPMKDLPRSLAQKIYREQYWAPIERAGIPDAYKEAVFDFGVNAGPKRAITFWRDAGGDINEFNKLRMEHYRDQPGWAKYGRGWTDRVRKTTPDPAYTGGEARIANAVQEEREANRRQALRDPVIDYYSNDKNRNYTGDSRSLVPQIRRSSWASKIEGMDDKAVAGALDKIVRRAKAQGITMTPAQAMGVLRGEGVVRRHKLIDYVPGSGLFDDDLSLGGGFLLEDSAVDTQLAKLKDDRSADAAGARETLRVERDEREAAQKAVQRAQQALDTALASGLGSRNTEKVKELRDNLTQAQRIARTLDSRS